MVDWVHMRVLGIDYGTKRIGLAISDEAGLLAFPYGIINNTSRTLTSMMATCEKEGITQIAIGASINSDGGENRIAESVRAFAKALGEATSIPVAFVYEGFSSFEAARSAHIKKPIANLRGNKIASSAHDDKAAAIILQRYLDTQQK